MMFRTDSDKCIRHVTIAAPHSIPLSGVTTVVCAVRSFVGGVALVQDWSNNYGLQMLPGHDPWPSFE